MTAQYDVIVVGQGAAEAALAALLARDGYAVALVGVGGLAPVVRCGPANCDYQPPNYDGLCDGPYARIAARLGVYLPVVRREPAWRIYAHGRQIDVPAAIGQWRRLRRAIFPAQLDAADRFWQAQETGAAAALRLAEQFDPLAQALVWRQRRVTVAEMLERYDLIDPALRAFVDLALSASGLPPAAHCPWSAGSVALTPTADRLAGDAATLPRLFIDALLGAGGVWYRRQRAVSLLTSPTRVSGARLTGGIAINGRAIVLGPAAWPLAGSRIQPISFLAALYLVADAACVPDETPLYQIVQPAPSLPPVTIHLTPAASGAALRSITAVIRCRRSEWPTDRRLRAQRRAELAEMLQAAVNTALPGLASGIQAQRIAAPLPNLAAPSARPPAAQAGLWVLRHPAWLPPGYDNGSSVIRLYRQLRAIGN